MLQAKVSELTQETSDVQKRTGDLKAKVAVLDINAVTMKKTSATPRT